MWQDGKKEERWVTMQKLSTEDVQPSCPTCLWAVCHSTANGSMPWEGMLSHGTNLPQL